MPEVKTKVCIVCKRDLPASEEYFTTLKKGKYGLSNVCKDCQSQRQVRGIGSKWRKRR